MNQLLLGNEAVARGVYEAGAHVATAYPGTPSTEITEYIAQYKEIYAEWSPNEKVALEVALGASVAGGRAVCSMKHVGLNVAADPLFTASYTGVNGGLVICVADDPGMHSSQNEQDSRHYAAASKTLMLEPSDSAECKEYIKQAFALSEDFDTPVILRLTTRISHSRSQTELQAREERPLKPYIKNAAKYVMMPSNARGRHKVVEERINKLKAFAETTGLNRVEQAKPDRAGTDNHEQAAKIGVITSGIAYQYAKEALGDSVSYLKLGMVYPLPSSLIIDFARSVDICYVIEELDPIIEEHCRILGLEVTGKQVFSNIGEYTSKDIREKVLAQPVTVRSVEEFIPPRPPVMCAGCPHRGVFYALKQMKLTVAGDIGCYTLGALPPVSAMDTTVCMGASIGMAHGMEKVKRDEQNERKTVSVIGDSTFLHSGITGLIDVVYNKGTSTVIILDNSITGMTGHQDHPGTGKTIYKEPTHAVNLEKLCEAVGVRRVTVVDSFAIDEVKAVLKKELEADEPSVVIARRPCKLLNVNYTDRYVIDNEKCRNCGLCMNLGCPALTRKGNNIVIDKSMCVGCGLCGSVCKSGAVRKI